MKAFLIVQWITIFLKEEFLNYSPPFFVTNVCPHNVNMHSAKKKDKHVPALRKSVKINYNFNEIRMCRRYFGPKGGK